MIDEDTVNFFQKKIDKIESLEREKSESFSTWIRHILTILVGLLTILVAFNKSKIEDCLTYYIFSGILISIALSVITGIIFLFHHVSNLKQTLNILKEALNKRLSGDLNSIFFENIKTKPIYKICEYVFYIFSILTVVLLVIYGIRISK
jgi:ABC-type Fe3+-siderophore transport system permease subunit